MNDKPTKFSSDVRRIKWAKKEDGRVIASGVSRCWYGRLQEPGRKWQWVKLFTDKRASQRRWEDLRRRGEHRQSGILTADVERLDAPIASLKTDYLTALRLISGDAEHVRISEWMLDRLIELGGWKRYADITVSSMRGILETLAGDGATASYQNKFIARAKAFVTTFLPDGWIHPLRKLVRVREKGAKKTRARRAAELTQLAALLGLPTLPPRRELAYALAARNGLRRNEARRLDWSDVVTDSPIPFFKIRHKQRATDTPDCIPIHPYVMGLLATIKPEVASGPVLPSVPDLKTLRKDLTRASIPFIDAQGRRLDYHALRHTFQTDLDRTGCSRATKKKLMRHASEDGTGRGTPIIPIDMRQASRGATMTNNRGDDVCSGGAPGTGIGEPGDPSPTVSTSHTPAIAFDWQAGESGNDCSFNGKARKWITRAGDYTGALGATKRDGVQAGMAVRRLTPRECERLQGFPDDYTAVPYRNKPAADGPRYRAIGNSMAVPVLRWLGKRIEMVNAAVLARKAGAA